MHILIDGLTTSFRYHALQTKADVHKRIGQTEKAKKTEEKAHKVVQDFTTRMRFGKKPLL